MLESSGPRQGSIGPYKIVSRLGSGGVGEVYRATDTRLGREVAIKVLLENVARDPERIGRFKREARVAASLNHSNIAAIYGFEDEGDAHFLVMELVEGRSLADRLKQGPLPIDDALAVVEQIAGALEAAHDAGIVHRDLKPSNVMLTPDGKAKILDFGLAKALDEESPAGALDHSPTVSIHLTSPGMMVGTFPYMSPEQARGRAVDRRSDVWALGCVLYECLTGRRAFEGETATDVLAKIVEREPDWGALPARTPPRIRELLQRCLEKDLRRRLRDAGDIRIELERAREAREWTSTGGVPAAAPTRRLPSNVPWTIAAVAVVAAMLAWFVPGRNQSDAPEATRAASARPLKVDVTDPGALRFAIADVASIAISDDGQTIAYLGVSPTGSWFEGELCLRRADEIGVMQKVPPPEPGFGISNPFFSPDGKWIGFSATGLYKIPVTGGQPVPLVERRSVGGMKGAVWTERGIIFAPAAKSGLFLVGENGGVPEALTIPDVSKGEVSHRWPAALPDGRHLLFTIKKEGITSFDQAAIALLDLETKKWKTLIEGGSYARYVPTGHIVYTRAGAIVAVPFDLGAEKVTGSPVTIVPGVMTEPGSGAAQFAVAAKAGALLYVPGGPNIHRHELVWLDRHGAIASVGAPLEPYYQPRLSPDATRVASTVFGATDTVVVYDIARGSSVQVKSAGNTSLVAWHPDGRQLLVSSDAEGGSAQRLYLTPADGSGAPRAVAPQISGLQARLLATTPSGVQLVVQLENDLELMSLDGASSRQRISGAGEVQPGRPTISPNGRWMAYDADVSGRREIFVHPFPSGNGTWQISRTGGDVPVWSPHGDELIYVHLNELDRTLMSVRVTETPSGISTAAPVEVMKVPNTTDIVGFSPDGQRFLAVRPVAPQFPGDRVLEIVNWLSDVEAKAPRH
ncbi:MAG TPA: protein kinase [Candidatus Polarisedimenticolaceae bacterium]|nr:protein kinase [Candidatus Polarisedimenticolaceae bacterium]